jgi:mono/diheme cytochrome c family protein
LRCRSQHASDCVVTWEIDMRDALALLGLGVGAILLANLAAAAGDAERGGEIADRWCAACHLVSPEQTRASADVPSFMAIAERSEGDLGWLTAFLADPHPVMPDMSLTRQEIQDLVAYFESLPN